MDMTIPREEFNKAMERLHDKLDYQRDHFEEKFLELKTSIIKINTKQDNMNIPTQPCSYFQSHILEHKENKDKWGKPIIVGLVVTAFMFLQEPIRQFFRHLFNKG